MICARCGYETGEKHLWRGLCNACNLTPELFDTRAAFALTPTEEKPVKARIVPPNENLSLF